MLTMAARARPMNVRDLREAAARYGGPAIAAEERARADARRTLVAELRRRFGEGPRLVLPLSASQMEFDPNQVTPVEGLGAVYGVLTIRDVWGELRAAQGALISSDFTQVVVAAPDASGVAGPGWSLGLTPAFRPTQGDPAGRRTIEANPNQL
jgi:hypothetical protein